MNVSAFGDPTLSDVEVLDAADFGEVFGETLSPYVAERIKSYEFAFRRLSQEDRDDYVRRIVDALANGDLTPAGASRLGQWEHGWGAHLELLNPDSLPDAIVPGYFGKYDVVRWRQTFIAPTDRRFEYRSLAIIQNWLFDKYLRSVRSVYDFGCGTGHGLLRVREVNGTANLWGLDWTKASQNVIARVRDITGDNRLFSQRFNLFEPDTTFELDPGAAIYTCAALEQTGERYTRFISYLLDQRPSLCIHIEPIAELLDEDNALDSLSIGYFKRRQYLSGFLDHLRVLEAAGRVTIHRAQRTFVGSLFIEGYSVIVWSPASEHAQVHV